MPAVELLRYRHPDPAFAIDLPAEAERSSDGALLVAREPVPDPAPAFRANLTVVAEQIPGGLGFAAYVDRSIADESEMLPGWRLIDREDTEIGGRPAVRTLATYLASAMPGFDVGRDLSVALEQWRIEHAGAAWIASVSCDAVEYALVAEVWRACAESLRPGETA
jgi:hypothetical protein